MSSRDADVNVASPPPSTENGSSNSSSSGQVTVPSSNKLLSLLKAKKEKEKDEVSSPQPAINTALASSPPPGVSPPQPSSSASSPTSASSSTDSLAKLAFWKKKSASSSTTPKGFRSASFTNLPPVDLLQNTSSMALAAATGKGKAGAGGDKQQQQQQQEGEEGKEPTSASSPTKSSNSPVPESPSLASLSATPPVGSSLPVHQSNLSPSLNGSAADVNTSPSSPSVPISALPASGSFSLLSSSVPSSGDAVLAAASVVSSAAASNSSNTASTSSAKTSSSYYSTSSYYSSLGGSTSLAAFRQSIALAKSPSFSSTAGDTSTISVTAPSSPRNNASELKTAAVLDSSSSLSASPAASLSTSPVTSPIVSPRRMPRASSLDTTLQSLSSALLSASLTGTKDAASSNQNKKASNVLKLLQDDTLSLDALRRLAWSGVPTELRSVAWKLLLEYVPVQRKRRDAVLENRRNEYHSYLADYDRACSDDNKSEDELAMLRQIRADIPRTTPGIAFFKRSDIALSRGRSLYVFALRHPASGYVQGMNDLITPFYTVFVHDWHSLDITNNALTRVGVLELEDDQLLSLEADCYWCLSKLLDGIQDNYTFAQPGIQRAIYRMREIVERVDAPLIKHLDNNNVQLLHFAFRWMNCLLMRELNATLIVRLWDSYLADDMQAGFKTFHLYVCVALLVTFSKDIKQLEGGELIVFLQRLPTENWKEKDIDTLIAQAFLYRSWFDDAPRHLK